MRIESLIKRRLVRWALIFGFWTLVGFFYACHLYLIYSRTNQPTTLARVLPPALVFWYSWAVLTPFILWLARHFQLERRNWIRALAIHIPASLLFALAHETLSIFAFSLFDLAAGKPWRFFAVLSRSLFTIFFSMEVVIYWMMLFASHAFEYYRRYREEELKASQLESRLTQAQLQALKMQLHPHFLFNTLHAISALIHKAPDAADEMVARLSDLLRLTLDNVGTQEVTLKQELEFLEHYLEIEQTRFQDRLSVEISIDPETLDAQVPNLILQPLVENAIRHGIAPRPDAGRIEISAKREDGMLHLRVSDDGPGLPNGGQAFLKEGVGLANTRARIECLYGGLHQFELKNIEDGGLVVSLVIPFRISESESEIEPQRHKDTKD
jgi:two-component system, LytTR family, sensor kinase